MCVADDPVVQPARPALAQTAPAGAPPTPAGARPADAAAHAKAPRSWRRYDGGCVRCQCCAGGPPRSTADARVAGRGRSAGGHGGSRTRFFFPVIWVANGGIQPLFREPLGRRWGCCRLARSALPWPTPCVAQRWPRPLWPTPCAVGPFPLCVRFSHGRCSGYRRRCRRRRGSYRRRGNARQAELRPGGAATPNFPNSLTVDLALFVGQNSCSSDISGYQVSKRFSWCCDFHQRWILAISPACSGWTSRR